MSYASIILADTPKGYYRLGEGSGIVAHDATSNHFDATLPTGCTYGQPGNIVGDSDTCILFPAGGSMTLPYTLNIMTFSACSIEFWIDYGGAPHYVVATYTSTGGGSTLYYVDAVASTPVAGNLTLIGSAFEMVGAYQVATLDEVAIYDYALSPAQITSHFSAAQGIAFHPLVLFPAMTRRSGTVSMVVRRDGMASVALVRRSAVGMSTKRRDGSVPLTPSRRSGPFPATQRRDAVGMSTKRRDAGGMNTSRRTGLVSVTQRRG